MPTSFKHFSFKEVVKTKVPGYMTLKPRALLGSNIIAEDSKETPTMKLKESHAIISGYNFNKTTLIFRFNGFWPFTSGLNEWTKQSWIIDHDIFVRNLLQ